MSHAEKTVEQRITSLEHQQEQADDERRDLTRVQRDHERRIRALERQRPPDPDQGT